MDESALYKITHGLYILGARDKAALANERIVGSTIDAVMQVANKPLVIAISCNNNSYTRECIIENGEFTLSVMGQQVSPFVVANFGFQTSRKVDKWNAVEHFLVDGLPFLKDNLATFRCEVLNVIPYESNTLIVAEIVDCQNTQDGEPLTYNNYRDSFKNEVMRAFKEYTETKQGEK